MHFVITKVRKPDDTLLTMWSLHRTEKGEAGQAICRSVDTWPTERQARANINIFKRATSGKTMRYTPVQVKEVDLPNTPAVSNPPAGSGEN